MLRAKNFGRFAIPALALGALIGGGVPEVQAITYGQQECKDPITGADVPCTYPET